MHVCTGSVMWASVSPCRGQFEPRLRVVSFVHLPAAIEHRTKRHSAGLVIVQGLSPSSCMHPWEATQRRVHGRSCALTVHTPLSSYRSNSSPPLRRLVRALANCRRKKRHSAGLVIGQGLLACIRGRGGDHLTRPLTPGRRLRATASSGCSRHPGLSSSAGVQASIGTNIVSGFSQLQLAPKTSLRHRSGEGAACGVCAAA